MAGNPLVTRMSHFSLFVCLLLSTSKCWVLVDTNRCRRQKDAKSQQIFLSKEDKDDEEDGGGSDGNNEQPDNLGHYSQIQTFEINCISGRDFYFPMGSIDTSFILFSDNFPVSPMYIQISYIVSKESEQQVGKRPTTANVWEQTLLSQLKCLWYPNSNLTLDTG